MKNYHEFIKNKIEISPLGGFEIDESTLPEILKPHQRDIVKWALRGGQRAIFAQFGLGKTLIQLALMDQVAKKTGGKTLIIAPLGVKQEFVRDGKMIGIDLQYVRTDAELAGMTGQYFITNYERVRDGNLNPAQFDMVTLDEASILRGFGTKTYQEFLPLCASVKYKFVATATPSPNELKELIHYAGFLGVMDTGEALTRFFQRNSEKAADLSLLPNREKDFWMWVSSWAVFLNRPSDLGYSDEGYDLPPFKVIWHRVDIDHLKKVKTDRRSGQQEFFHNAASSLPDAAREKRDTIPLRVAKTKELVDAEPAKHFLLWHHLEDERRALCEAMPETVAIYGEQDIEEREQAVIDFSDGKIRLLATKPELSGSGCNFQRFCSDAIFVGINYMFNDFIQAVHRIYRFLQTKQVTIHIIYADSEEEIKATLLRKWKMHDELTATMAEIIRKYGLSVDSIRSGMRRAIGCARKEEIGNHYTAVNWDCVEECSAMPENSVDLICSSIPFSNHYEYSANYNDFGHNVDNDRFFDQMDFLTPQLLRILKPGRVAAIHVKDRVLFGSVTGCGMPTIDPFSDETVAHFRKHGFQFFGRITIETDVVRENNQTYRLGWTECCKDQTKMGVGCPEYLLLFRKLPTDRTKAYADFPVVHSKEQYTRGRWQIDARAKWNSSGNRFLTESEMENYDLESVNNFFNHRAAETIYNYEDHLAAADAMEKRNMLPATFETFRIPARSPWVWGDVARMRTLNGEQARKNLEKHICPLQFDIVERVIERWSNPGETVLDPFGGIMTVPYCAVKMDRYGIGVELNPNYWHDGCVYLQSAESDKDAPTLFNLENL